MTDQFVQVDKCIFMFTHHLMIVGINRYVFIFTHRLRPIFIFGRVGFVDKYVFMFTH